MYRMYSVMFMHWFCCESILFITNMDYMQLELLDIKEKPENVSAKHRGGKQILPTGV